MTDSTINSNDINGTGTATPTAAQPGPNVHPDSRSASPVAHLPSHSIQSNLANKSIWRLLLQYSGPAVIAYVCTSLYNIIDSVFIGHGVGPMALAGLAITLPLMNLVVAFCTLVAAGGSAISSIFIGQKRLDRAEATVNNVVFFCLVHAIIFGGLTLIFLKPILYFFGATDVTYPYAEKFMRIILYATPISYIFLGLNNLLRATGYPRKAMVSALLSVAVNLILAPILIFHFKAGIAGAAWATVAGQTAAFVWVVSHFISNKSLVKINIHGRWVIIKILKSIYRIGLSPFLMNICACIVVVFLNKSLLHYGGTEGNYYVGAYGIINRVTMVFVMIVFGVTQGMQPILGFNWGAGNWQRVKQTLYKGMMLGGIITAIGFIMTQFFPDTLSKMFTDDQYMVGITRRGFHIYFCCYPLVGIQIVIQNFFQSIGKPLMSILLSMTRQMLFLLPFLIILPDHFGVDGIWASMAASDGLAFLVAILLIITLLPRYAKEIAQRKK